MGGGVLRRGVQGARCDGSTRGARRRGRAALKHSCGGARRGALQKQSKCRRAGARCAVI